MLYTCTEYTPWSIRRHVPPLPAYSSITTSSGCTAGKRGQDRIGTRMRPKRQNNNRCPQDTVHEALLLALLTDMVASKHLKHRTTTTIVFLTCSAVAALCFPLGIPSPGSSRARTHVSLVA
ncbi:hypothetical protein F4782DRAFT_424918 [Xylaria castorea]|nr:hypothetical protein F4782DRAFT_424918 [Xylaria castorea]